MRRGGYINFYLQNWWGQTRTKLLITFLSLSHARKDENTPIKPSAASIPAVFNSSSTQLHRLLLIICQMEVTLPTTKLRHCHCDSSLGFMLLSPFRVHAAHALQPNLVPQCNNHHSPSTMQVRFPHRVDPMLATRISNQKAKLLFEIIWFTETAQSWADHVILFSAGTHTTYAH